MSVGHTNPKMRQALLELKRHEEPCLLTLRETVIGVKTVGCVDESGPMPVVRRIRTTTPKTYRSG